MSILSDKELADDIKIGFLLQVADYLNSEYAMCKSDAEVCRVSGLIIKVRCLISEEQAEVLGKLVRTIPPLTFMDNSLQK